MKPADVLAYVLFACGILIVLSAYVDPSITKLFAGVIPIYPSNNPAMEERNIAYVIGAITFLIGFLIYYVNRPSAKISQP